MKVRNGFVSNSSSSSFVLIDYDGPLLMPEWANRPVVELGRDGDAEFGWGPYDVTGIETMINFAYLQTEFNSEWRQMLEEVIREHTGVQDIEWVLSQDYDDENGGRWGYIDHQSHASEGRNTEIFDSKETLRAFLFGADSKVHLDNDNY